MFFVHGRQTAIIVDLEEYITILRFICDLTKMDENTKTSMLESIWIKDDFNIPDENKWVTAAGASPVQVGDLPDGYNYGFDGDRNIVFAWGDSAVGGVKSYLIPDGLYDPEDGVFHWLEEMGIRIGAHIYQILDVYDVGFDPVSPDLTAIRTDFPVLYEEAADEMRGAIAFKHSLNDSIGGSIECAITGLPAGLGEPMFGGVESRLSSILYGIPAVKCVEFGLGYIFAFECGSEANDAFTIVNGQIKTLTNDCGGILGGITNGMPIIFKVTLKPTPSIAKPQQTVNLQTGEITTIEIKGRHDPCIVPRAVPVVEAAAAIAIYDLILGNTQTNRRKN